MMQGAASAPKHLSQRGNVLGHVSKSATSGLCAGDGYPTGMHAEGEALVQQLCNVMHSKAPNSAVMLLGFRVRI